MNLFGYAAHLWRLGHFPAAVADLGELFDRVRREGLDDALKSYQGFHGLAATAAWDAATLETLGRPRCALPDVMPTRASVCKWPMKTVAWAQAVDLPGVPPEVVARVFRRAWQSWADACGVEPVEVEPADAVVNVLSLSGSGKAYSLDGPGGVLAWSQLPCQSSATSRLRQVYDRSEPWTEALLLAVAAHEIGHALGLDHDAPGTLMAPYADPGVVAPTAADVAKAVNRYGPPAPKTPPPAPAPAPPPEANPAGQISLDLDIARAGKYQLRIVVAPKD